MIFDLLFVEVSPRGQAAFEAEHGPAASPIARLNRPEP